jgi:deoxycytidine triphosphate deaminase
MIIGLDILLERVKKGELIINLSQRELDHPEGAGFDLRAGEIYRIKSSGYLGVIQRQTPDVELIASYTESGSSEVILQPSEYYLVKIIEEITLDPDMLGIFHPRSTLFRSGVVLQTGVHPPGYSGAPTFGLYVAGNHPFRLEVGARIAHINILRIEGLSSPYRGQWQGGRVTTGEKETQV